jgi:hypothetical protein
VRQIVVRLVKKDMTQPCADDGAENQIQEKVRQIFKTPSFSAIDLGHDLIAQKEAKSEKYAVPADVKSAEAKDLRGDVPHDGVYFGAHDIISTRWDAFLGSRYHFYTMGCILKLTISSPGDD